MNPLLPLATTAPRKFTAHQTGCLIARRRLRNVIMKLNPRRARSGLGPRDAER